MPVVGMKAGVQNAQLGWECQVVDTKYQVERETGSSAPQS